MPIDRKERYLDMCEEIDYANFGKRMKNKLHKV